MQKYLITIYIKSAASEHYVTACNKCDAALKALRQFERMCKRSLHLKSVETLPGNTILTCDYIN